MDGLSQCARPELCKLAFFIGTAQNTKRIARFLDLDFWNYDEHVMRDFRIVLFDADGRVKREIVWVRPKDLEPMLANL